MILTITIPDDAVEIADEYCQRECGMSFQQLMQQIADDKIKNVLHLATLRSGLKKDMDNFFGEFGKILKEATDATANK